jgi:imidazolonepropionase-like amidohydrolase
MKRVDNPVVRIRAIDAINPEDIGRDALKAGVTTVVSCRVVTTWCVARPPSKWWDDPEEMLVAAPVGMKISFGERPKGAYGNRKKSPMTRMGISAILRETLIKTHNYMKRKGERDLRMESLIAVIKKTIPFRAHAHRADDIMTAIRIAKEFSVRLVIEHGTDGYKVAPELAAAKVPVVHGPWIKVRGNVEQAGRNPESPRILIEHGVLTSFSTDHPVIAIQNMRLQAINAVEEGVSPDEALKAVTINSARIMGIEKRVGS